MRVEKLTSEQRDAGWTNYRKANKEEIREAHKTPGVIVGVSDSNYANSSVAKANYLEQVIAPEQARYESRLMGLLWPEMVMLEVPAPDPEIAPDGEMTEKAAPVICPKNGVGLDPNIWVLDFKEMSVADKMIDAQVRNVYLAAGVKTPNEIRMELGMKPLPDGDKPKSPKEGPSAPDITGMGDRPDGGRGPNGTMTAPAPRRPGDTTVSLAANATTMGRPLSKDGDTEPGAEQDLEITIPAAEYGALVHRAKYAPRIDLDR